MFECFYDTTGIVNQVNKNYVVNKDTVCDTNICGQINKKNQLPFAGVRFSGLSVFCF